LTPLLLVRKVEDARLRRLGWGDELNKSTMNGIILDKISFPDVILNSRKNDPEK
jgi:hypothetical protein